MTRREPDRASHLDPPRTDQVTAPLRLPQRMLRPGGRAVFRRWYDVHERGAEQVPDRGGVIIASNHVGLLDGPLVTAFCPRPVHALTKVEMFRGAVGLALRVVGQIPVRRTAWDPYAVKTCIRVLREGGVVAVYPEGTRGAGEVERAAPGVAYLALVTGAPVVPLAMFGTREPGGGVDSIPPRGTRVDFCYGAPVPVEPVPWPRRKAEVADTTEQLRKALVETVVRSMEVTGLRLPGPAPAAEEDPDD